MQFIVGISLFLLCLVSPLAWAKAVATDDCPDCSVKKRAPAVMSTQGLEQMAEKIGAIPASLPAEKKIAAIFGKDDRVLMKPGYPANSIGRILRAGMDPCTATRVSACHILTASHCVRLNSGKIHPKMAYQPPFESKAYMVKSGAVLAGEFSFEKDDLSQDWAIAQLEESDSGTRDGWLGIKDKKGTELMGQSFSLTGMQQDLSPSGKDFYTDPGVKVIRTAKGLLWGDPNVIFYRGDTEAGTSGGPIYEFDAEGKAWIVGVNSAEPGAFGGTVRYSDHETDELNQGVASNQFFARIQKFMAENPCPPVSPR